MATISAVRTALASTISSAISGIEVYSTVPGTFTTPCVVIDVGPGSYPRTMGRGYVELAFEVTVIVNASPLDEAQDELDGYLNTSGATSIDAAIFATPGLGLTFTDATCSGFSGYGPQTIGERDVLTATVQVIVRTKGTA